MFLSFLFYFIFQRKKRSRLFYQRYVMQSIIYNVLCSSSFRSMFNVHWDIILFTGENCNTSFAFASKFIFYWHLPLCILPCTSPCVMYSCDVYLMKKSPLKRRIKRIETFIIYALFSVVTILFPFLLTSGTFQLLCFHLYHINKCDKMHSTIFTSALTFTGSHTSAHTLS